MTEELETNYDELFASGPAPEEAEASVPSEPVQQAEPQPEAQPEAQPEQVQQTTDANPFDEGSAQWKAFEMQRKALLEKAEAEREAAILRAQQERDQQWQAYLAQQQQAAIQPEEKPDPITDPDAYEAYLERKFQAKYGSQIEQMRYEQRAMAYNASLATAQAMYEQQGGNWQELMAAANEYAAKFPGIVADIQRSPNPGLAIVELGKERLALKGKTQQPGQPQPSPTQALAQQAQALAAQGAPPQTTAPRGVGSVAGGQGYGSAPLPAVDDFKRLAKSDPDAWANTIDSIIANGPAPGL